MMKLRDDITTYPMKKIKLLANTILVETRSVIGHGNKPIPKIRVRNSLKNMYGLYSYDYIIDINPSECKTLSYFIGVIIHEYTHHIQRGLKKNYDSSVKKYGYYNCPFEVEARGNAKKYKQKIWRRVKKKMLEQ